MKRRMHTVAVLSWMAAIAPVPAAPEVWVAEQAAARLAIIDPETNILLPDAVELGDPDGNGQPDPVYDIAVSTAPAHPGTRVFVAQGRFLRVVDAPGRRIVQTYDLDVMLGPGVVEVRGIATAVPRRFEDIAGGPAIRSFLWVSYGVAPAEARFAVFDQDELIAGSTSPWSASGSIAMGGEPRGVTVSDLPRGDRFQRAWFVAAVRGTPNRVVAVEVAADPAAEAFRSGRSRSYDLPTGASVPEVLVPATARGREFPTVPLGSTGRLVNPDLEGSCAPGGEPVAARITGTGPFSYTVFAPDRARSELVAIDPRTCDATRFFTGAGPVAVATLGNQQWTAAFTADFDGDQVTRLDPDGTVTPIDLGGNGGACDLCPVDVDATEIPICVPVGLQLEVTDTDSDGENDDLRLTWAAWGCPTFMDVEIWCQCWGEDDCPADCDCSDPLDPDCAFPAVATFPATLLEEGVGDTLLAGPNTKPKQNPWKRLGGSANQIFEYPGGATLLDSVDFGAALGDE